ncbi:alpha/beta-hydrolase [Daedalea quercina L-15889]|uniref:Alpha/beta-hydrolase n=1 Tax=Daedalea quercina L-15889 TaxID=1314783 RepID=A0A165PH74_9APHY|nr:alpha/beta-hydrolase [Daedalea quercina L-15889]
MVPQAPTHLYLALLGLLVTLPSVVIGWGTYPDTDVVIVSNNDLDPSNANRASALYLKSVFSCADALIACEQLQEILLPAPNTTAGLTAQNLSVALTSERHGAALDRTQQVWIAASSSCAAFTPSYQYSDAEYRLDTSVDSGIELPVLCTNSAPLTRSNVSSYDTTRQVQLTTPSAGVLTGYRDKFSFRFLGIKYAESTAGNARFQPPTALTVDPATEVSALEYGNFCPQPPDADNGHQLYTDEDCLYLNVFSPVVNSATNSVQTTPKLPVMFFIHGGGLNTGDSGPFPYNMTTSGFVGNSTSNIYDGTNLVSYGGVVLVTINYRLTAFGWFNASNAALRDALLALQWVQDNIESFGGDPTKVLVYGESAGGVMTRYLLGTNPTYTEGLFSAAILESDFGQNDPFLSIPLAQNISLRLAQYLGCASNSSTTFNDTMALCVQKLPAGDIAMASYNLGISWSIAIDGDYVLTDIASSIRDGAYARVPTIWASNECEYCYFLPSTIAPNANASVFPDYLSIAFNSTGAQLVLNATDLYPYETAPSEDGISGAVLTLAQLITDFDVHCPEAYLASLETNTTNPGNSYKVVFAVGLGSPLTPNPETCVGQVCHADELYWVFATAETDNLYQPLTSGQVATTREAINRWTSLAWSGNPNYEGAVVEWPPYTGDNELVINATATETIEPYRSAQCDFLESRIGLVFGSP